MGCGINLAALPFQAHANYGTWSIDFDTNVDNIMKMIFFHRIKHGLKGHRRYRSGHVLGKIFQAHSFMN